MSDAAEPSIRRARGAPVVAVMQPYFYPYLGYFQLMAAADEFVLYDDAQYSKHGWSNRNRILRDGRPAWLTLPVARVPSGPVSIRERRYVLDAHPASLSRRLRAAYPGAPWLDWTMEIFDALFENAPASVAEFNARVLRRLAAELGIGCRISWASEVETGADRGTARVLALCRALGAGTYLNAPGGVGLYSADAFSSHGLALRFLSPRLDPYPQAGTPGPFVPGLSVLDALMAMGPSATGALVHGGSVVAPDDLGEDGAPC